MAFNIVDYHFYNLGGLLAHGLTLRIDAISSRTRSTVTVETESELFILRQLLAMVFYRDHAVPRLTAYICRDFNARDIVKIEMLLNRVKKTAAYAQPAVLAESKIFCAAFQRRFQPCPVDQYRPECVWENVG